MFSVEGKTPEAQKNAKILETWLNATYTVPTIPQELLQAITQELITGEKS
jgi:hypothetical protein